MDSFALLEQLCNVPGIPGFEDEVRETIIELVTPLVDDVRVDVMGSVIATRRGRTD